MSRGPGNQQRRILEALEKYPAFYLSDLYRRRPYFYIEGRVDDFNYRAEQVALNRAAHQLCLSGKIEVFSASCTNPRTVISRPAFYSWEDRVINPLTIRRRDLEIIRVVIGDRGKIYELEPRDDLSVEDAAC